MKEEVNMVALNLFKEVMALVFSAYKEKGFYEWFNNVPKGLEVIADLAEVGLICSEVGELQQAIRKGKDQSEECADIAIRLFNYCNRQGIDLEVAIIIKNDTNMKREHRHGDI